MMLFKLIELLYGFLKETQLGLQIYKPAFFCLTLRTYTDYDQEAPPLSLTFDIPSLCSGLNFISGRALLELLVGGGIKPPSMK